MCIETHSPVYQVEYKTFIERLLSFEEWPGPLNPVDLAIAGFEFTGIDDICRCFYCNVKIHKWTITDIPINEHVKYSTCPYASKVEKLIVEYGEVYEMLRKKYLKIFNKTKKQHKKATRNEHHKRYKLLIILIVFVILFCYIK